MKLLNRSEKGVEKTKFFQKKIILFFVLVLFIFGCAKGTTTSGSAASASGTLENGVRVVNVNAFMFDFDPNTIIVNKDEKIRLVITSTDVIHGFALPEYNINTPLPAGKQTTIEFIADKQGTFPFICSVYCGGGHSSMRGSLIVR